MYYRYRMYDAGVGKFTARDPIGYLGGISLYVYVSSKPYELFDPYGLIQALKEARLPDLDAPIVTQSTLQWWINFVNSGRPCNDDEWINIYFWVLNKKGRWTRNPKLYKEIGTKNDEPWTDEDLLEDDPQSEPEEDPIEKLLPKSTKFFLKTVVNTANIMISTGFTYLLDERVYLRTHWKKYEISCPCDWLSGDELEISSVDDEVVYYWNTSSGVLGTIRKDDPKDILNNAKSIKAKNTKFMADVDSVLDKLAK